MRIVTPSPVLSPSERRLLTLLGRLIEWKCWEASPPQNRRRGAIPLTDGELQELQEALEAYVASHEFMMKSFFVENICLNKQNSDGNLREIYFSQRADRGRKSRIMSSRTWAEFKIRLGIEREHYGYAAVSRMSFDHFMKMEFILFRHCGIDQALAARLLAMIQSQREDIERTRSGRLDRSIVSIKNSMLNPLIRSFERMKSSGDREVSLPKLSAVLVLVSDLGVLFTTRDWDVAGTSSAMGAALAYVSVEE